MRIDLDRRDTVVLRGISIFAIVFHNYYHFISPVGQNEFAFHPGRFRVFLQSLHDPIGAIEGGFSLFGHFGVEIFVFLSAYGLAKSHWDGPTRWGRFFWGRIKKLYPVFGLAVLPWLAAMAMVAGPAEILRSDGPKILWMTIGVSDLVPGCDLPPVGPWWFIPFIVQFYALWPPLKRFTVRFGQPGLWGLASLSPLLLYFVNPWLTQRSMSLLAMPLGHIPECCLGVIAARFSLRLNFPLFLAGAADLILGSIYRIFWPFTFASAVVVALYIYQRMRPVLRRSQFWQYIGKCSLLIFLVNGVIRLEFLTDATSPILGLIYGCVSAVTSFTVAALIQEFLMPRSMAWRIGPKSAGARKEAEDASNESVG